MPAATSASSRTRAIQNGRREPRRRGRSPVGRPASRSTGLRSRAGTRGRGSSRRRRPVRPGRDLGRSRGCRVRPGSGRSRRSPGWRRPGLRRSRRSPGAGGRGFGGRPPWLSGSRVGGPGVPAGPGAPGLPLAPGAPRIAPAGPGAPGPLPAPDATEAVGVPGPVRGDARGHRCATAGGAACGPPVARGRGGGGSAEPAAPLWAVYAPGPAPAGNGAAAGATAARAPNGAAGDGPPGRRRRGRAAPPCRARPAPRRPVREPLPRILGQRPHHERLHRAGYVRRQRRRHVPDLHHRHRRPACRPGTAAARPGTRRRRCRASRRREPAVDRPGPRPAPGER